VAELALDDLQRHALASELDCVRVAQLMLLLLISAGVSRRMPRFPVGVTDSRTGTAEGRACR